MISFCFIVDNQGSHCNFTIMLLFLPIRQTRHAQNLNEIEVSWRVFMKRLSLLFFCVNFTIIFCVFMKNNMLNKKVIVSRGVFRGGGALGHGPPLLIAKIV